MNIEDQGLKIKIKKLKESTTHITTLVVRDLLSLTFPDSFLLIIDVGDTLKYNQVITRKSFFFHCADLPAEMAEGFFP